MKKFLLYSAMALTITLCFLSTRVQTSGQDRHGRGYSDVPLNMLFLAPNGSDTSGQRGTSSPFLTPLGAIQAAQYGDVIYVSPGTYATETNLAKNGVTWIGSGPSCVFSNFADNNILGSSNAMFTDIYGATNFSVLGNPTLIYHTGTNWFGFDGDQMYSIGATNANSLVYLNNTNTVATFQLSDAQLWTYESGGGQGLTYVFWINSANTVNLTCATVEEPLYGVTFIANGGPCDYCPLSFTDTSSTGLFVGGANVNSQFNYIRKFGEYGFNWNEPPDGFKHTNNIFINVNEIDSFSYGDVTDNSYRLWMTAGWINCPNSPAGFRCYGGYNYLTAMKISSVLGVDADDGAFVWLNCQKIECTSQWLTVEGHTNNLGQTASVWATVQDYADGGGISNGIALSGGTNFIIGGSAIATNGVGVNITGGVNSFNGLTVDTSSGSGTNRWPVEWASGTQSGVALNGVTLKSPAGTASIFSGTNTPSISTQGLSANTAFSANVASPTMVTSAATSGTVTVATGYQSVATYLSSGSTITSITVALPTTGVSGQTFYIHTKSIVATLSVTGGSFNDAAVTALTAGQTIGYQAVNASGAYIRIQ